MERAEFAHLQTRPAAHPTHPDGGGRSVHLARRQQGAGKKPFRRIPRRRRAWILSGDLAGRREVRGNFAAPRGGPVTTKDASPLTVPKWPCYTRQSVRQSRAREQRDAAQVGTAATVAGSVLWALLPAILVGWDRNVEYLGKAVDGLANLSAEHAAAAGSAKVYGPGFGVSIPAFAARYFGAGGHTASSIAVVCLVAVLFCLAVWGIYRVAGIPLLRHRGSHVATRDSLPGVVALK